MSRPVVLDLFCGLGGWTRGFLAEGWDAIGFDIERHEYGDKRYPGELILADVLTLNGYDLAAANPSAVVASPPCQEFSYMAMPWKRAKQIAAALRGQGEFPKGYTGSRTIDDLCRLFNACFRIQRELSDALGHYVPMVVENVKGAQPWVGRAKANFGSYYLWGDVARIGNRVVRDSRPVFGMPAVQAAGRAPKQPGRNFHFPEKFGMPSPFHGAEHEESVRAALALKTSGHVNQRDGFAHTRHLTNQSESDAVKHGGDWFSDPTSPGQTQTGGNPVNALASEGTKQRGSGPEWFDNGIASVGSRSNARKAASAMIAEIPFDLAAHIARVFKP